MKRHRRSRKLLLVLLAVLVTGMTCTATVSAKPKASKVTVKMKKKGDSRHYYKYTGKTSSGKKVWTYKTSVQPDAQLTDFKPKPIVRNGLVYVKDGSRMVALKQKTGKVAWKTPYNVLGAVTDYCFDSKGNIYICGYLGPDLIKINKKGKVVWRIEKYSKSDRFMWPYQVSVKGKNIRVTYEWPYPKGKKISVRMSDGRRVQ